MIRRDIITTIGEKFYKENIESGEWSYSKSLGKKLSGHQFLDIRFVDGNISIVVETKQSFTKKDRNQLFRYIELEKELTGNDVIGILANTNNDDIEVWKNDKFLQKEVKLKTFEEYKEMFETATTNDKEKIMKSTYRLNEMMHANDIDEVLRSQFVGTCLLALKNKLNYERLSTAQIIAGIGEILSNLLNQDVSTARGGKLNILCTNILTNQKVRTLQSENFIKLLDYINDNILPFIDDKTNLGQDLLNLFFTTFNKYVGKKDKNQAFTPNHIVDFMCKVARIDRNSVVFDPTCGSGAFLVQAMTQALNNCRTKAEKDAVKKNQIFGIESEERAFGLSTTNMLIHGDGNSNVINANCFDKADWIEKAGIDIVLMNPPYNAKPVNISKNITKNWGNSKKEDPTKGFCFVNYTANQVRNGVLLCLLPLSCAIGNSKETREYKKKMLENNTLDAVFTLPPEMFHPGASVNACCMVFKLNKPHPDNYETFFGYYKDDGHIKKKNLGRVDVKNQWDDIEKEWLDLYENRTEKDGISIKKQVNHNLEWLAEAYIKTDYTKLSNKDFEKTLKNYLAYLIVMEDYIKHIYDKSSSLTITKNNSSNVILNLNISTWKTFSLKNIFYKFENCKCSNATDLLEDGDEIYYIGAKKNNNGIMNKVMKNNDLLTKGNCIVFICDGQGSVGYSNYMAHDFIGSTTLTVGYNKNLNQYIGMFLVSILDKERYKYSFGRKYRTNIETTKIKLPVDKDGNPDWKFMEDYIKSLPYGDLI